MGHFSLADVGRIGRRRNSPNEGQVLQKKDTGNKWGNAPSTMSNVPPVVGPEFRGANLP
jgi:hypothetical protein